MKEKIEKKLISLRAERDQRIGAIQALQTQMAQNQQMGMELGQQLVRLEGKIEAYEEMLKEENEE